MEVMRSRDWVAASQSPLCLWKKVEWASDPTYCTHMQTDRSVTFLVTALVRGWIIRAWVEVGTKEYRLKVNLKACTFGTSAWLLVIQCRMGHRPTILHIHADMLISISA